MSYTESGHITVDLDPVRTTLERFLHARTKKNEWAEEEAAARAEIEHALGECDAGTLDGREVVRWTTSKRRSLDQTLLRTRFPEIAAECTALTEVRRFTIVDETR